MIGMEQDLKGCALIRVYNRMRKAYEILTKGVSYGTISLFHLNGLVII